MPNPTDQEKACASVKSKEELLSITGRKRLLVPEKNQIIKNHKKRADLFKWAIQNSIEAVIFPFGCQDAIIEEAGSHGLIPEAGGYIATILVPRSLFFFHRDYFRMESGKRKKKIHFCPTNPDTIKTMRSESKKIFAAAGKIGVFHIWPDKGDENTWCSCPACRAFTCAEQYRIAVNAAADVLAEIKPDAMLSCRELAGEEPEIALRPNVFIADPGTISFPGYCA